MNSQELQICSFEQAKRLKKAGFDWECDYAYVEAQLVFTGGRSNTGFEAGKYISRYTAPPVALAIKWLRDEKGINNAVSFFDVTTPKYVGRYQVGRITDVGERRLSPRSVYETESFNTYESAESALLGELLTILDKEQ